MAAESTRSERRPAFVGIFLLGKESFVIFPFDLLATALRFADSRLDLRNSATISQMTSVFQVLWLSLLGAVHCQFINHLWRIGWSSDLEKVVAIRSTDILTSSDGGLSWTDVTPASGSSPVGADDVAMSSDGSKAVAVVWNGHIWSSSDGGTSWTEDVSLGVQEWRGVAMSSSGSEMAAVGDNTGIWLTSNGGTTWSQAQTAASTGMLTSVAISSDGSKIAAVGDGGLAGLIFQPVLGINSCESIPCVCRGKHAFQKRWHFQEDQPSK